MLPYDHSHPDDRDPDDQDVSSRQWQVSHLELDRGEDQVRHKIDGERQRHLPRQLLPHHLHEHEAKRDEDDRVENLPNHPDGRWCWRPRGFLKAVVPVKPSHLSVFWCLRFFRFIPMILRL